MTGAHETGPGGDAGLIAFLEASGMVCAGVDEHGRLIWTPAQLAGQAAQAMASGEPVAEAGYLLGDDPEPGDDR